MNKEENDVLEKMNKYLNQQEKMSKKGKMTAEQKAGLIIAVSASTLFATLCGSVIVNYEVTRWKNNDSNGLYYGELCSSYICQVEKENGRHELFLLRECGYDKNGVKYIDTITNTYLDTNNNNILSKENVTVWLSSMNKIQDWYSINDLRTFLADISEEKDIYNSSKEKTYTMKY